MHKFSFELKSSFAPHSLPRDTSTESGIKMYVVQRDCCCAYVQKRITKWVSAKSLWSRGKHTGEPKHGHVEATTERSGTFSLCYASAHSQQREKAEVAQRWLYWWRGNNRALHGPFSARELPQVLKLLLNGNWKKSSQALLTSSSRSETGSSIKINLECLSPNIWEFNFKWKISRVHESAIRVINKRLVNQNKRREKNERLGRLLTYQLTIKLVFFTRKFIFVSPHSRSLVYQCCSLVFSCLCFFSCYVLRTGEVLAPFPLDKRSDTARAANFKTCRKFGASPTQYLQVNSWTFCV